MDFEPVLAIGLLLFLFALGVIALGFLAGLAYRIVKGGGQRADNSEQEARLMQEVYVGLEKLNNRVESLETIMLDEREQKNMA